MARNEPQDVLDAFLQRSRINGPVAAVDHRSIVVSYAELADQAFRIAGAINSATIAPCPRVLLTLPSSPSAYAAMLGTLIAGGTFCPVDVDGPRGRNEAVCRLFAPNAIVFFQNTPDFLDVAPATTQLIDASRLDASRADASAAECSDVAYVVFTSGSTGAPKGVKIGRRAFSHFIAVAQTYFRISAGERWGQWSNLGHDLGVMDVFMALCHGGTLVPLSAAEKLRPAKAIMDRQISIWQSVPTALELMKRANQITSQHLAPLRIMSFCGEPLYRNQLEALFTARPDLHVFNTYGATETVGFNTLNDLTLQNYLASCDESYVAIGADVSGWELLLRGGQTDDEGEIVMAGDHLSLGYWDDEEKTRIAFRQVDAIPSGSRNCYFTGDRGVRKGSRVFCLGRNDRQVKICGERIELEEIDGALRQMGFGAAYTIFRAGELYSFVEASNPIDEERIRNTLSKSLPFHAVPKAIRALPLLPRNPNGKLDREALAREIPQ